MPFGSRGFFGWEVSSWNGESLIYMGLVLFATRWTPSLVPNRALNPYEWVIGAIKSLPSGVITLLVTGLSHLVIAGDFNRNTYESHELDHIPR